MYQLTGKVHLVRAPFTKGSFTKREFIVETSDNPKYPQLVMMEATGDRISQLDRVAVGDVVEIQFSIRGREWKSPSGDVKYFTTLDVGHVHVTAKHAETGGGEATQTMLPDADIPF